MPHPKLSFIPPLLPDSTLYSWCAIYHQLSGNASGSETRLQLFGSRTAARLFSFPSSLDVFCARTQLVLGDPLTVAMNATVLPYYLRLRPANVGESAIGRMKAGSTSGLLSLLSITKSGVWGGQVRRYCPECLIAELAQICTTYWHRCHQLPGVLVCPYHEVPLMAAPLASRNNYRSGFVRPGPGDSSADFACTIEANGTGAKARTLRRLSILARDMLDSPLPHEYSNVRFLRACESALSDRAGASNSMDDQEHFQKEISTHFQGLDEVPEIAPAIRSISRRTVRRIVHQTDCRSHPLELMLVIDWLFGNWETFRIHYAQTGVSERTPQ